MYRGVTITLVEGVQLLPLQIFVTLPLSACFACRFRGWDTVRTRSTNGSSRFPKSCHGLFNLRIYRQYAQIDSQFTWSLYPSISEASHETVKARENGLQLQRTRITGSGTCVQEHYYDLPCFIYFAENTFSGKKPAQHQHLTLHSHAKLELYGPDNTIKSQCDNKEVDVSCCPFLLCSRTFAPSFLAFC
ncbi:hypothetical protein J3R30DRAFT_3420146 [Lentinula aciculospora]|uniref:Uncharacterized protein n=1 Tax=Lentinula aciculospora TaxID=153920 RepID=A0A9W9DXZ6_9AGAR|nr:hypothetical protein J3R30DRAFT_3420146 [Lentinula aciculospora]